jgi:hypothetical protein
MVFIPMELRRPEVLLFRGSHHFTYLRVFFMV